jgi:hypothetical protein
MIDVLAVTVCVNEPPVEVTAANAAAFATPPISILDTLKSTILVGLTSIVSCVSASSPVSGCVEGVTTAVPLPTVPIVIVKVGIATNITDTIMSSVTLVSSRLVPVDGVISTPSTKIICSANPAFTVVVTVNVVL